MLMLIQYKGKRKTIKNNRRRAIRERCINCAGWSLKAVTTCEFTDCPLYAFRSGKGKQNAKARAKAIRNYCLCCMNGQRAEVSKCTCPDCPLFPYRQGRVDRSAEIDPTQKKQRIEAVSGAI